LLRPQQNEHPNIPAPLTLFDCCISIGRWMYDYCCVCGRLMLGAETIFLHAHDVHQLERKELPDGKMIGRAAPLGVR